MILGAGGLIHCTILDPFVGSGNTFQVAAWLSRRSIGIR
jgi:DNA modification methylase